MQFTGVKVVIDLVSEKMSYWFVEPCVKCNGAGIIVCPKCKGSKTLRSRPARIVVGGPWMKSGPRKMLLQHAHEVCRCWKCGRDTPADFNMCGLDNNDDRVMRRLTANFFAAQIGKPMPHLFEPTAGTVVCNTCWGKRFLRSQGWGQVNLEKFQLFDPPDHWYQITGGMSACRTRRMGPNTPNRGEQRKVGAYLEFPNHPRPFTYRQVFKPALKVHPMLVPSLRGLKNKTLEDREGVDLDKAKRAAKRAFRLAGTKRLPQLGDERMDEWRPDGDPRAFP